jgi:hypothetical protein
VTSFCFYLWFREKQAFQKIIHVKPYSAHIYSLIKSRFAKNRLSQNYFLFHYYWRPISKLFFCQIFRIFENLPPHWSKTVCYFCTVAQRQLFLKTVPYFQFLCKYIHLLYLLDAIKEYMIINLISIMVQLHQLWYQIQ